MTDSTTNPNARHPILILGMDRSGTSLVANLVALWGAHGGDETALARANDFNPQGFFENEGLQLFLADLLNGIDVGWWDPAFPGILRERAADPAWQDRAVQLLDWMAASGRPWFWKEPMLSVLLPFWQPFLGECVYVIPVRDPYDSAVSYEKMAFSEPLRAMVGLRGMNLLRWQCFLRACLEAAETAEHKIFVPYEELTADPATQCRRIAAFLDARYGPQGPQGPAEERIAAMTAAVDVRLRRHRAEVPFEEREDVTPEQKALYRFLQAKCADASLPYRPELYPMYAGWRESLHALTVLTNVFMELEPCMRSPLVAGAYYLHCGLSHITRAPRRWWKDRREHRKGDARRKEKSG